MKVVIDRGYCDTNLAFCQRCSSALFRNPEGYDRPCILDIIDDGKETLTLVMHTDGRMLELELSDAERELAAVEGWEALAHFDPLLFRTGALERWRALSHLPATDHVLHELP